ncbi:MAG TPA: HAMP domain-containing sensor histidine kinase [Vicinamibacterales bacterium]|nr:HAMP domain-containing sensor histidine kinase [Vicinamibacterales bacterium]
MTRRSLRTRVLIGAALWTVGFFLISGAVMMWLLFTGKPHIPDTVHQAFGQTLMMLSIATILVVTGFVWVRRGLGSLSDLRARLADVHSGKEKRVVGDYPSEAQPLVADLNALLDAHDENVARAQSKAGDLAHGLKTPLAILAQEADRARAAGQPELADTIAHEVSRMRRQIDYHLAHARAAASSAAPAVRSSATACVDGLRRTLARLYVERRIAISADTPADLYVRVQREDLDEILGNLLDNACKWAKTRVALQASGADGRAVFTVDDDGPGLDPGMREAVLNRGVRADQAAPGTGLGLAIVRDLAGLYGGSIYLGASPLGGLRATLTLPQA